MTAEVHWLQRKDGGLGTQVKVRPVGSSDVGAVAALMTQLGYPMEVADMRLRLERIFARTDYRALVAELDGVVVGLAVAVEGLFLERNGS